MRTLSEISEELAHRYDLEELVELLDIPIEVFLERFDDFIERKMDELEEELFDD